MNRKYILSQPLRQWALCNDWVTGQGRQVLPNRYNRNLRAAHWGALFREWQRGVCHADTALTCSYFVGAKTAHRPFYYKKISGRIFPPRDAFAAVLPITFAYCVGMVLWIYVLFMMVLTSGVWYGILHISQYF